MADKTTTTTTKVEIKYIPAAKLGALFMKAQMSMPEAFLDASQLELVDMPGMEARKRPVTHPKNLETIYRSYQVIDGTPDERTAMLKIRSMSMGDAIVVTSGPHKGRAYYVVDQGRFPSGFAFKDEKGELVEATEENCL